MKLRCQQNVKSSDSLSTYVILGEIKWGNSTYYTFHDFGYSYISILIFNYSAKGPFGYASMKAMDIYEPQKYIVFEEKQSLLLSFDKLIINSSTENTKHNIKL